MNALGEKITSFKTTFEELPKTLKPIGIIGSICGFFYLFAYTREASIPFPLELSVLPTALLFIGAMSVLGTAMIVGGILVPALLADDHSAVTSVVLLAEDVKKRRALVRCMRYVVCAWLPMVAVLLGLLILTGMFGVGAWNAWAALLLAGVAFLSIILPPQWLTQKDRRVEYIAIATGQTVLSVAAYFLAVVVSLAIVPEVGTWNAWYGFLFVLAVFTLIHFLVTMPNDGSMGKKILLPPNFEFKTTPATATAFGIITFFVMLSVLIFPVNAKIGKVVLASFGVGGGIPIIVCLKDVPPSQIAKRIEFNGDGCTEPLALLFDAGDRLYVAKQILAGTIEDKEKSPVGEPIYFRQDQVLEKVYLPISRLKTRNPAPSK